MRTIYIGLLALVCIEQTAAAERVSDVRDVGLGSWSTEVKELIRGTPKIEASKSLTSDEKWTYDDGVEVYLCHNRVAAVEVPLVGTLRAWVAAVAKEQADRGAAELDTGMSAVGLISARWQLRSGGHLSLNIQDVGGTIIVSRWLESDTPCT